MPDSTDKDECSPNPCRNNGSCTDSVADFLCTCRDGWKGKTCNLKDSHCDRSTCRNGGTCQDLGDTYVCRCPPEWEGTTCHIGKFQECFVTLAKIINKIKCLHFIKHKITRSVIVSE